MRHRLTKTYIDSLMPKDKPYEVCDDELNGLRVRVQPTGLKTYYVTYYLQDGRRSRLPLGRTTVLSPKIARENATQVISDALNGEDPAAKRKAARAKREAHTLESYLDEVHEPWVSVNRRTGTDDVSRIKSAFRAFLETPLTDIQGFAIDKWRTQRLKDGTKKATVNRDIAALKSILSKAVEWGFLPENPSASVKPVKLDASGRVRFLNPEEQERLSLALDKHEEDSRKERDLLNEKLRKRGEPELPDLRKVAFVDYLRPMVILSLNTGMRRGEVFNLEWEDVNLDAHMLTVKGSGTKSGNTRHIPLNSDVVDALRNWCKQTEGSGLVFRSPKTNGRFDNTRKSWKTLLSMAEIADFRWHDMRHHFASMLVMAGVDLNTARELLGHADIKMTLRYAHLAPQHKAAAVEKLVQPSNVIPCDKVEGDQAAGTTE